MTLLATKQDLFGNSSVVAPVTEGIKYAGSKLKLLPHILSMIDSVKVNSIFDGFAGSTRVSQGLASSGYRVICNDAAVWSQFFGECYLRSKAPTTYKKLIEHLNNCQPVEGWFTSNYGGASNKVRSDEVKMPWQRHNTMKLDAIREEIDFLNLSTDEKAVAITSLIMALDQVDSTMGHYSSYLREWSPRSFNKLALKVPKIVSSNGGHEVHNSDVFSQLATLKADLAYYDPPYGSNNEKMPPSRVRYSSYYHVWTTVCLNDQPELFGKVNRRTDTRDSVSASIFEDFRKNTDGKYVAVEAIHKLLKQTPTKYILLSYSSGGRATAAELQEAMSDVGRVINVMEIDYRRNVMASMTWTREWLRDAEESNREFLFLIER